MPADLDAVLTRLSSDFPTLSTDSVLRQLTAAAESVELFGIELPAASDLVERLARSHLESLAELRRADG